MAFLQPITRNLPGFIQAPMISVIGQECYTTLIYNVDLGDLYCIKYSISKGLGLGIVVGGGIVKIPQILKILKAHSARGLSLSSYLLDTSSLIIGVAYNLRLNFPLSTYGENIALAIQNVIIICLIVLYNPNSLPPTLNPKESITTRRSPPYGLAALGLVLSLGTFYILLSETLTPMSVLRTLLKLSIPLSLSAKFPQIIENFRNQSTGQLSAFLVFNSLAGCLARVYTTQTETGDSTIWWSFMLAAILNGVIALQLVYYWKAKGGNLVMKEKEKREEIGMSNSSAGLNAPIQIRTHSGSAPSSPRIPSSSGKPRNWVRKAD